MAKLLWWSEECAGASFLVCCGSGMCAGAVCMSWMASRSTSVPSSTYTIMISQSIPSISFPY